MNFLTLEKIIEERTHKEFALVTNQSAIDDKPGNSWYVGRIDTPATMHGEEFNIENGLMHTGAVTDQGVELIACRSGILLWEFQGMLIHVKVDDEHNTRWRLLVGCYLSQTTGRESMRY